MNYLLKKNKIDNNKKFEILEKYFESLLRFQDNFHILHKMKSPFFQKIYINHIIFQYIQIPYFNINQKENLYERISFSILHKEISYDDITTLFKLYIYEKPLDKLHFKNFISSFYKKNKENKDKEKENKNIVSKFLILLFTFHIYYTQFFLIFHDFIDIPKNDLEYFLYLFVHHHPLEEKNLLKKNIHYFYFHYFFDLLFTTYYRMIHYLQDVSSLSFSFDIHNTHSLKKSFFNKIVLLNNLSTPDL
jgi:hypothetical protein